MPMMVSLSTEKSIYCTKKITWKITQNPCKSSYNVCFYTLRLVMLLSNCPAENWRLNKLPQGSPCKVLALWSSQLPLVTKMQRVWRTDCKTIVFCFFFNSHVYLEEYFNEQFLQLTSGCLIMCRAMSFLWLQKSNKGGQNYGNL